MARLHSVAFHRDCASASAHCCTARAFPRRFYSSWTSLVAITAPSCAQSDDRVWLQLRARHWHQLASGAFGPPCGLRTVAPIPRWTRTPTARTARVGFRRAQAESNFNSDMRHWDSGRPGTAEPGPRFPVPVESGNGGSLFPGGRIGKRGFPPRFPAKKRETGDPIPDSRVTSDSEHQPQ